MNNGYDKILVFVNDIKVSKIFLRVNVPVEVIRSGKRLRTKVILSQEDLLSIFNYYSELAKIPFTGSRFSLKFDNLFLEGLNSNDNNSYLIIQKKTAYSLLEGLSSKKKSFSRSSRMTGGRR
jgi:hypothetical protein